jgi:uncharacterized protein
MDDFARALALVLVIEGMLPFLAPARWRSMLLRVASVEDRYLRIAGLLAMLVGIAFLQVLRMLETG